MLDLKLLSKSIARARDVLPSFGLAAVTTLDRNVLLARARVLIQTASLPERFAAILIPGVKRHKLVLLNAALPHSARHLVLLHEAGHRYQRTDRFGVAYDNGEWRTGPEMAADAFAAVGLFPKFVIDDLLQNVIWESEIVDLVADELAFNAGGIWSRDRALCAASHRMMVRKRLNV